ncbi:antitoxin MazE family protein [Algiphilus aromaticivorans]|uniref:antitoxin MazE family protein n=1 Tax=Algiphilus aromaticivorans TaxID=382454 RepID=UPI0009FFA5C7|nr:antitoxin MazE family protein [Algiphilus aromaticivorans]
MATSGSERVQKRREALRAAGLRPVQLWVPDTRKQGFAAECRRQSALLAADPQEDETLDWIERVADTQDWS